MQRKHTNKIAALAAVALIIALFTACSAGDNKPASGDKKESSKIATFDDWQLAFAKCMRAEGLDVPDPNKDGSMAVTVPRDAGGFEKARKKCRTDLGEPPTPPGQKKQSKEQVLAEQLKTAKCFRDAGFDVPDPKENMVSGLPANAPEDVLKKCIPGFSSMGSGPSAPTASK